MAHLAGDADDPQVAAVEAARLVSSGALELRGQGGEVHRELVLKHVDRRQHTGLDEQTPKVTC